MKTKTIDNRNPKNVTVVPLDEMNIEGLTAEGWTALQEQENAFMKSTFSTEDYKREMSKQRSAKYNKKLDALAKSLGFSTWRKFSTAAANNEFKIVLEK